MHPTPSFRFPLQAGGTETASRFPLRSRGNLKEGVLYATDEFSNTLRGV